MAEYKRETSIAVTIAIIAALGIAAFAIATFPKAPGFGNNSTTTPAGGTVTQINQSRALPCTAPGVVCGGIWLDSATLEETNGTGNDWLLSLTVNFMGNTPAYSIQAFLGNTSVAYLRQLFFLGKNSLAFHLSGGTVLGGQSYSVRVEAFYGNSTHIWANAWSQAVTILTQ